MANSSNDKLNSRSSENRGDVTVCILKDAYITQGWGG